MEILKNVILVLHFIGIASLLGGVIMQSRAMREAQARIVAPIMHGAWTMLITGVLLVGLQYPIGNEVNNTKITVKLLVLLAIIIIALINRKREALASWVLPTIGALTVINIAIAALWVNYS
ncbi:hypothetical protein [Brevibacterium ihuae]|uniref:hypothetical protein n=1 Tax=Brevibacterium ihuae TaxID=1631743 RepID=UPI000C790638|nr:hypothetical protein [Brevibacterium ihuae]